MISRTIFENKLNLQECSSHPGNKISRVNLAKKAEKFFYCPQCLINEGFNLENIKNNLNTLESFVSTLYSGGATVLTQRIQKLINQAHSYEN